MPAASTKRRPLAIAALSDAEGQECLHAAIAQTGLQLPLDFDCSPERLGMEVWLKAPDLLLDASRQHGPHQLAAFECFGAAPKGRVSTIKIQVNA